MIYSFKAEHLYQLIHFPLILQNGFTNAGRRATFFVIGRLNEIGCVALIDQFGDSPGTEKWNIVCVRLYGREYFSFMWSTGLIAFNKDVIGRNHVSGDLVMASVQRTRCEHFMVW
jgi:hypothetical protein